MRIVSGRWGGRIVKAPSGDLTRPTLDAHRETLFNILVHRGLLATQDGGIRILDFFAGTGALSFEALSRIENLENSSVIFFENNSKAIKCLETNIENLVGPELSPSCQIVNTLKFEKWPQELMSKQNSNFYPVNLIFSDPPYSKNLISKSMQVLEPVFEKLKILSNNSCLVLECEKELPTDSLLKKLPKWSLSVEKILGITKFLIFIRRE